MKGRAAAEYNIQQDRQNDREENTRQAIESDLHRNSLN
jgi:hypothetical protein